MDAEGLFFKQMNQFSAYDVYPNLFCVSRLETRTEELDHMASWREFMNPTDIYILYIYIYIYIYIYFF